MSTTIQNKSLSDFIARADKSIEYTSDIQHQNDGRSEYYLLSISPQNVEGDWIEIQYNSKEEAELDKEAAEHYLDIN